MVIQGDTLAGLCSSMRVLADWMRSTPGVDAELMAEAIFVHNGLVARLLHYQDSLSQHGIELPYSRNYSDRDLIDV